VKFPEETGRTSVRIQKDRFEIDFIRELSEDEAFTEQIFELPVFSSLRLGDRLEFWTGKNSSRVLHRGSIVTLYPNSVALEYQEDDTASGEGARRTERINGKFYSSRVRRRLSSSQEAAESTETRPARVFTYAWICETCHGSD
jgi:hypothetical protein